MGQTSSEEKVREWGNVQREVSTIMDIAVLNYDEFVSCMKELNKISQSYTDVNGKRLIFAVKKGTDSSLLWKATVKIGCVRVDASTKQIESYSFLTLRQFVHVYKTILCHVKAKTTNSTRIHESSPDGEVMTEITDVNLDELKAVRFLDSSLDQAAICMPLSTSVILKECSDDTDDPGSLEECCICMDRKPEIILPCAHNYCLPCIEQWNDSNKTCPVCREEVEDTSDSWVISDAPDSSEMAAEVRKLFNGFAEMHSVS